MKIQANDMLYNSLLFSKLEIEHSKMASLHKRITTSMVTSWCFLDNNAAPSCAPSLMKQMRNSTACYTSSLPLGTYIFHPLFCFSPSLSFITYTNCNRLPMNVLKNSSNRQMLPLMPTTGGY